MAASGDPIFMRPLAEPENLGAMSIGIAHIGPMVNSEKKKAKLKQIAADETLWTKKMISMQANEQRKPPTTKFLRAFFKSPVFLKMRSLTIPPNVSPITPAKKTPAEKSAEFFTSSR